MWSPTHVQVTVCRIKGLLTKGKNGTNDAFVTISLGKEKFQTSVKQKALSDLEWQEECELAIPTQGNTAEIVLTALHQNFIGVDEFLGMVSLPLSHFDVYERPRTKWYPLKSKPGQEGKNKHRGEIEVRVAFTVKSGSLLDLSKKEKHKGSFGHISQAAHNIGGSLMSLGKEKKGGIKKLASSVGSKLRLPKSGSRDEKGDGRLSRHSSGRYSGKYSSGEPDPGVISEDDDEFRFDELSHKSSGSSLNLAGGSSSLASGQGSLENLGGGELLRHNSMKRSGSSATLPNRAIQSSSSISSLAVSATSGGSKSPSQQQNDWNQKFFGAKQSKVSETPVGKQSEEKAPVPNVPSSPTSLMAGGVPSIIIQDSFIVEEPSLSPSSSPSLGKSNNNVAAPVPKARNNKNQDLTMEVEVPVVVPQPRQRKELPTVEEVPVEIKSKPTGEEAEAEFDTGQSLSARSRMSPSPPPSFPVDDDDDDDHFARPPPVPKPRRSPVPPTDLSNVTFITVPGPELPVPPPRNVIDYSIEEVASKPIQLNPFDSDSDQLEEEEDEEVQVEKLNSTFDVDKHTNVLVLSNVDEADEMMLDEDQVCEMLEKAIEEHDQVPNAPTTLPPPKPNRVHNVVELYDDDFNEEDGSNDENAGVKSSDSTMDIYNELTVAASPVDLFINQEVKISPVEKIQEDPVIQLDVTDETPTMKGVRRDRLFSLFSTPNSETDTDQQSVGIIRLDWSEDSQDVNGSSQGFGGSEQLSSGLLAASGSDSAKTLDSAVSVTEDVFESSPSDSSPLADLTEARNRPLELILPPHLDINFTPPPASALSISSVQSSAVSNKAELSWDNYDMKVFPTTPLETVKGRLSIVPEPIDQEAKARQKRVSLGPSLKTLTLEEHSNDQTFGSPITEDDEDDAGEQAAVTTPVNTTNETHRMKMAASFHQRVVVGEDKPANNNTSRDHHRTPRDTSTTEDRLRVYQEKSREGLISLLEDRDSEISDLKDYIDSLLLRVIDTCPTVLQTPVKAKQSTRK